MTAADYEERLVRGALVNTLGLTAKLINPLYFVVITWLFGPATVGLYFLAVFIAEVATNAAVAGFADATTVLASRYADGAPRRDTPDTPDTRSHQHLYRVLGNAFAFSMGISLLLVPTLYASGGLLVSLVYPDRPELETALHILAWSIPLTALPRLAIAATKARMVMHHDALITGVARPLTLLGFTLLAWLANTGLSGLLWAIVATQIVVSMLAVRALAQHFELGRILHAILHARPQRELLAFAVPQSINATAFRYLSHLDVFMLAALGHGNFEIAFYATAALIASNLREIKLIFSQALAPVAARHHAAGNQAALEETLGRVSRWTTSLVVPAIIAVLVLRGDLLYLVDSGYTADSLFMVALLIPPFLSCAFGLAGNTLIFTGHPSWTLFNSLLVAGLNTLLNLWLIPAHGLLGAAIATALAASMISLLQLLELRYLEGIQLRPRHVWKPHLAFALTCMVILVLWDPAQIQGLGNRLLAVLGLTLLYTATLAALRHEELLSLARQVSGRIGLSF
ncbi:MAG: polysaccharide biosynthesis C-terminal domain-containing protein [Sedimenticola sp.]